MRVVTARNSSSDSDTVSEYCYKLGLEAGGKETVLGYTAMEGYQVRLFCKYVWIIFCASDANALPHYCDHNNVCVYDGWHREHFL